MFAGDIEIPRFNEEIRTLILQRASDDFDWSLISPTIFGAVFESTLNPETRRAGGMHYTSIENIHKVIDPLFLNDLKAELADIKATSVGKAKRDRAIAFQDKISDLKFFDPACGSGNFLTESYMSLRRLENEALRIIYGDNRVIGELADPIKVSINQFYGIEINDFACSVAQAALWIAESQMMAETDEIVGFTLDPLPLKTYNNIREGNALLEDWSLWDELDERTTIVAGYTDIYPYRGPGLLQEPVTHYGSIDLYSKEISIHSAPRELPKQRIRFDYIMGNPPFIGYSMQSPKQKKEMLSIIVDDKGRPYKTAGKLDYVAAWYFKTALYMQDYPGTKAAFVSTNSITQGEQVAGIWEPLIKRFHIGIDFAYRTFRWDSESNQKAHVHCVIIGFSAGEHRRQRIYYGSGTKEVNHINPYLIEAEDVFISGLKKPLCNVPEMTTGNRPADGGNLIIEAEDCKAFVNADPTAGRYIKRLMGSEEFINNKKRYCLWLAGVSPAELRKMPKVMERVAACRKDRLNSPDAGRRKLAETPAVFREILNPAQFIAVPKVSSEKRKYIPIGFLDAETIPTDLLFILPDATTFHFGVLASNVHMAWMRVVCGRLKSDYRYSKDIVYNNFPWPDIATEARRLKIEQTAQGILDARALYPDSSLADLYDELTMPAELRRAHRANDAAVLEAYGFPKDATESDIVARLFKMYHELIQKQ